MSFNPRYIFQRDERHEGVRRINIFLLRLTYILMFFMLGRDVWTHIIAYQGPWEPNDAMAWSVWAAFAALAGLGIFHPLKMLPVLLLEILYKPLWLILVAYPLWVTDRLSGSPVEYQTFVFLGVIVPILATPWGYVFSHYLKIGVKRSK